MRAGIRVLVLLLIGFLPRLSAQELNCFDFHRADSISALYSHHTLADLKELAMKLTQDLPSDIEKFRSIFRWVCTNIENDYSAYMINKTKRDKLKGSDLLAWDKKFSTKMFRNLDQDRKTVCTGYAYLIRELSYFAGLECKTIHGFGRTAQVGREKAALPNHSWNAIKLDGRWFLSDATWSSGVIDPTKRAFVASYTDAYFMVEPPLFARNHSPLDSAWAIMDPTTARERFEAGPLYYRAGYKHQIDVVAPERFEVVIERGDKLCFEFTSKSDRPLQHITIQTQCGSSIQDHQPEDLTSTSGSYAFSHRFISKGTYAVHVLIDGEYSYSHEVLVK